MARRRGLVAGTLAMAALLSTACASGRGHVQHATASVAFGVYGDTPYSPDEAGALPKMVDQMNQAHLEFTIMVGDLKGGERCDNTLITGAADTFNSFSEPLVYVPGDNEWTDCHPYAQDPIERLAYIRRTMFATNQSFGKHRLTLAQQRPDYPENSRWRVGPVLFVGLNVPGSNNNHFADPDADERTTTPRGPQERRAAEAEFQARDQADREWLHQAFQEAARTNVAAVVIAMQADPDFATPPAERAAHHNDGYDRLLAAFVDEAKAFAKPVLIVHGDSHRQTFDKPLIDWATGQPLPNVTRVEGYGSPDVGWVRVTVDPGAPEVFRAEPHLVASFRPA